MKSTNKKTWKVTKRKEKRMQKEKGRKKEKKESSSCHVETLTMERFLRNKKEKTHRSIDTHELPQENKKKKKGAAVHKESRKY